MKKVLPHKGLFVELAFLKVIDFMIRNVPYRETLLRRSLGN